MPRVRIIPPLIPYMKTRSSRLGRREFLQASAATAATLVASASHAQQKTKGPPPRRSSLIAEENAKPGALDWQLTRVRLDKTGGTRAPRGSPGGTGVKEVEVKVTTGTASGDFGDLTAEEINRLDEEGREK